MNAYLQFQAQTEEQFLSTLDNTSFNSLCHGHIQYFKDYLLANFCYSEFSVRTCRAKSPLQYQDDLTIYMALYGLAHYERMTAVFESVQKEVENHQKATCHTTIVDYGCGQGIATLAYIDYLLETQQSVEKLDIILIEPSSLALNRAIYWIKNKAKSADIEINIRAHACTFDELEPNYLDTHQTDTTYIHLFSNILDMYSQGYYSLQQLSSHIKQQQAQQLVYAASPDFYTGNIGFNTLHKLLQPTHIYLNESGSVTVPEFHTLNQRMRTRVAPVRAYAVQL